MAPCVAALRSAALAADRQHLPCTCTRCGCGISCALFIGRYLLEISSRCDVEPKHDVSQKVHCRSTTTSLLLDCNQGRTWWVGRCMSHGVWGLDKCCFPHMPSEAKHPPATAPSCHSTAATAPYCQKPGEQFMPWMWYVVLPSCSSAALLAASQPVRGAGPPTRWHRASTVTVLLSTADMSRPGTQLCGSVMQPACHAVHFLVNQG